MLPQFHMKREQAARLVVMHGALNCEFHFHSHIELIAVEQGQIHAYINDRHRILQQGEMALVLSHDAHCWQSAPGATGVCLIVPTALCPEFMATVGDRKLGDPFIQEEDLFPTVLDCCRQIRQSPNPLVQKGYLYVLLGKLLERICLEPAGVQDTSRRHTDVLVYLNHHYQEALSLASVAAALGYNSSYLSRSFKQRFRFSLPDYITMLRLRHAVQLLEDPQKSITDCAFESGFQSLRSFYRAFEREFRCSPKQYRQ